MPRVRQGRSRRQRSRSRVLRELSGWVEDLQRRISPPNDDCHEPSSLLAEAVICLAVELHRYQLSQDVSANPAACLPTFGVHDGRQAALHDASTLATHVLRIVNAQWRGWLDAAMQLTGWRRPRDSSPIRWADLDPDWVKQLREGIHQIAVAEKEHSPDEFYEHLLAVHNRHERGQHGVYYTPAALAEFLVGQADEQLVRAGLVQGILGGPGVQILDPAAGSGAFITAIIRVAHRLHCARQADDDWQTVADGLLHRLGANELMPVAAAIGQLRTVWQLLETGYSLHQGTVVDWVAVDTLSGAAPECLSHRKPPTVIVGNPPYQSVAPQKGDWIEQLMRGVSPAIETASPDRSSSYFAVDGEPLNERKIWLHDAYIRFLRWAQWCVEVNGWGVVSLVLNHGLLDNVTFRGVREKLVNVFDDIRVVDLHGSTKAKECAPDGSRDENLFNIATGVAALCLSKTPEDNPGSTEAAAVHHVDLWGARDEKLRQLSQWQPGSYDLARPPWQRLTPSSPEYLLVEDRRERRPRFEEAPSLPELMPLQSTAPVTARDRFLVDADRAALVRRLSEFADLSISDAEIRQRYFQRTRSKKYAAGDTRGWQLTKARQRLAQTADWQQHIRRCLYRPFDWRYILWIDWMVDWPRPELTRQLTSLANIAIIARRQMLPGQPCNYFWATRHIALDGVIRSDNRGSESLFPLWVLNASGDRVANFDATWLDRIAASACLNWTSAARGDLQRTFGAADLFAYIYGLFFTPDYRERFDHFLRRDFPRVVLPVDRRQFAALALAGHRLLELHLAEATVTPGREHPEWPPISAPRAPRERRLANSGAIPAQTARQSAVVVGDVKLGADAAEWDFRVGGYEVVRKWLRTRRGRRPDAAEVAAFRHMLTVIRGTMDVVESELSDEEFDASDALNYC